MWKNDPINIKFWKLEDLKEHDCVCVCVFHTFLC